MLGLGLSIPFRFRACSTGLVPFWHPVIPDWGTRKDEFTETAISCRFSYKTCPNLISFLLSPTATSQQNLKISYVPPTSTTFHAPLLLGSWKLALSLSLSSRGEWRHRRQCRSAAKKKARSSTRRSKLPSSWTSPQLIRTAPTTATGSAYASVRSSHLSVRDPVLLLNFIPAFPPLICD